MSADNYKISILDLKAFLKVIQANLFFIVALSLLGFAIGYFFVTPNQGKLKVSSFVKFDRIKHQTFINEFDINISETFPQYVNKYFTHILNQDQKADVESFVVKDGGIYDTKIITVMVEDEKASAEMRFTKLYNSILDLYELEVYKDYSTQIENIKHAYDSKNGIESIEDMLNKDDKSDMVISYLLGMQYERSFHHKQVGSSQFVNSNQTFENYKKQLLMNGILTDEPSKLFDRKFLNTQIEPLGSSTALIPLVCAFIGLFLSILIIILLKNVRFIK